MEQMRNKYREKAGFSFTSLAVDLVLMAILASMGIYSYSVYKKRQKEETAKEECRSALTMADRVTSHMLKEGTLSEEMLNREARKAQILENAKLDGTIEDIEIPDVMITRMVYRTKGDVTVVFDSHAEKKFMVAN